MNSRFISSWLPGMDWYAFPFLHWLAMGNNCTDHIADHVGSLLDGFDGNRERRLDHPVPTEHTL